MRAALIAFGVLAYVAAFAGSAVALSAFFVGNPSIALVALIVGASPFLATLRSTRLKAG